MHVDNLVRYLLTNCIKHQGIWLNDIQAPVQQRSDCPRTWMGSANIFWPALLIEFVGGVLKKILDRVIVHRCCGRCGFRMVRWSKDQERLGMVVGRSLQPSDLLKEVRQFACCDVPVPIEGETGTCTELDAREVHCTHFHIERPSAPVHCCITQDCVIGIVSFGPRHSAFANAKADVVDLIELACVGPLSLDEVNRLPLPAKNHA